MSIEYRGERFVGYNKPKRTPGAKKSHAVLAKVGSEVKLIRFGQQGVQGSPKKAGESEAYRKRRESFKARHTPFFTNYRPQFYFRTTDVTGVVTLAAGTEMVMPGDNVNIKVELIAPIAMDEGLRFAIREGGRTVGAGRLS